MTLEEQLYLALRSRSCNCQLSGWHKVDGAVTRTLTHKCSRCAALERYEQEKRIERSTGE